jgi:periplasmic divalent cation tolerance protein
MTTTLRRQQDTSSPHRALVVLTTWPADRDPMVLARPLVEEGIAACVNVLPIMESVYRWQNAVHQDPERQLLIKTTLGRLERLEARITELHPYELPELLVIDVSAGAGAYLDWIAASTAAR